MTMNSVWLSTSISLISMLLAAVIGMRSRAMLREHHKNVETTDLLRVTVTMLVTFAAIVLGLLITSSKANFDTADDAMQTYAAVLSDLDDALQSAGPAAAPIPLTPAQIPIARARWWPENVVTMRDSVAGMRNAAPRPMTARAAMSGPVVCTSAQPNELAPNISTPIRNRRRRPKRSPRAPPNSSKTALVSV